MFGAVAVGMFGRPELGLIMPWPTIYRLSPSALFSGFTGESKGVDQKKKKKEAAGAGLFSRAVKMQQARKEISGRWDSYWAMR